MAALVWPGLELWPKMAIKVGLKPGLYSLHQIANKRVHDFSECTTFAPATIAPMVNANFKHNPNPNPNPNLNPYPTLN